MYHIQHKKLNYTPNKNLPIDIFPENLEGGKLEPANMYMSTIKEGIKSITRFLVANEISSVQATLNAEVQETIVAQALQNKIYQFPSSWYDTEDLSMFVEVPMYLLMLGVMKADML
jgi:hypothetical protein